MVRRGSGRDQGVGTGAPPRDVEALEAVLKALDEPLADQLAIQQRVSSVLATQLGCSFAGLWMPGPDGEFVLRAVRGELAAAVGGGQRPGLRASEVAGPDHRRVFAATSPVRLPLPHGSSTAAARCELFVRAGAVHGGLMPVVLDGRVVAVHEFRSANPLPFFDGREDKWAAIARITGHVSRVVQVSAAMAETLEDREAVTTVVTTINAAPDASSALRSALDVVRSAFGWAYGSFWALDEEAGVLRFALESGTAGEEFRRVTLAASFAEGVGLSGRAWRDRDLFFTADIGEMTDCVRAPAAQRAGVRSGVCFPLIINEKVIGTMDFFATQTLELSASREAALRQVAQLVIQRLVVLRRADADTASARDLLDTVGRLRATSQDAAAVGAQAAAQAEAVDADVQALTAASAAIGDIIKVISSIAGQTNLLALNATIEAARAGEVGKGFAVVAGEVKELARATADATDQVSQRIADIQASSASVAAGIHAAASTIAHLDAVQTRTSDVLEEQAAMAVAFSAR